MNDPAWEVLYRDADVERVRVVATAVMAMEYDARVVDASTGLAIEATATGRTEGAVLVLRADAAELHEVLADILAEQEEFDASIEDRIDRESRVVTRFFLSIFAVVALAVIARWMGWIGG